MSQLDSSIHQYHLNRDVRTYGKYELLYTQARDEGAVFMRYPDDTPPAVELDAKGQLSVTTVDTLTQGEELTIPADLVVLVTGMVPRANEGLTGLLKLPVGDDGFYNEIHPKLRPVETVVDGVMIAGTCQGPKTAGEAVGSGLAAVAQSAAILKKGVAELDPLVAVVNEFACTGCGECLSSCPYDAIEQTICDGKNLALIVPSVCKGCGGCVPVCTENAIDLLGYTDVQMRAMIDGLVEVAVSVSTDLLRDPREVIREEPLMHRPIREALADGPLTIPEIAERIGHARRGDRVLGHGDAPLWPSGRDGGSRRRRLLPLPRDRQGVGVMSKVIDTGLLTDMKRFGELDVSSCFSCGNCTAICPLADNDATFPRRIIRLAQVGLKDELLSSKELWTCYHCGLCSDSCPQDADPGEFMAAARRYAIASYDRTGFARVLYTRPVIGTVIAVVVAMFFALFMYSAHGEQDSAALSFFSFHPRPAHPLDRHCGHGCDGRRRTGGDRHDGPRGRSTRPRHGVLFW